MNFELTISGLCVLAMKSSDPNDPRPVHPVAVDVISPRACGHRSRISYLPGDMTPDAGMERDADVAVDPQGGRIASIDLNGGAYRLEFSGSPHREFLVKWGPAEPAAPPLEEWMNWVPTLNDLGFDGTFSGIGSPDELPDGAAARLNLPFGVLEARNIVLDEDTDRYLMWEFPAVSKVRALANEIVFRAEGVRGLTIFNRHGERVIGALKASGTLRMAITNDLATVPRDYNSEVKTLDHLRHAGELVTGSRTEFVAPRLAPDHPGRCVRPICAQVVHVYAD